MKIYSEKCHRQLYVSNNGLFSNVLRTFPWHNISFKTICAKEWIFLRIVYEPELESPYAEFWNCCFKELICSKFSSLGKAVSV